LFEKPKPTVGCSGNGIIIIIVIIIIIIIISTYILCIKSNENI